MRDLPRASRWIGADSTLTIRSHYVLRHGSRKRIRSRAANCDPIQPLAGIDGFCLAVDCLTPGCRGERVYSITALAACYDGKATVGGVLRLMQCAGCGKPVGAAWLVTGPTLNERVRPRRVALLGAEARG